MKKRIPYVVSKEDSLHKIAERFGTTVQSILDENVDICTYTLSQGDILGITTDIQEHESGENMCEKKHELMMQARNVWLQHVTYVRLVIISIMESLEDLQPTVNRLMQNPKDIAALYGQFPINVQKKVEELWGQHLHIGGELFTAIKANDEKSMEDADRRWHINAEEIAQYISSITPYCKREDVYGMMLHHLRLTKREAQNRHLGDYTAEISDFDAAWKQIMGMADYFAKGIVQL